MPLPIELQACRDGAADLPARSGGTAVGVRSLPADAGRWPGRPVGWHRPDHSRGSRPSACSVRDGLRPASCRGAGVPGCRGAGVPGCRGAGVPGCRDMGEAARVGRCHEMPDCSAPSAMRPSRVRCRLRRALDCHKRVAAGHACQRRLRRRRSRSAMPAPTSMIGAVEQHGAVPPGRKASAPASGRSGAEAGAGAPGRSGEGGGRSGMMPDRLSERAAAKIRAGRGSAWHRRAMPSPRRAN